MKIVIYKQWGVYQTTTEENYNRTVMDAREVCSWENFNTADEIIDWMVTYGRGYNKEDFIVIE